MRTKGGYHGLKRIKLRQSWNKFNLYNLWRVKTHLRGDKSLFHQKWTAKSRTRAYHGEHVGEKQWERMFRPSINAVVPLDPNLLARTDGSEQSAGRGSGLKSHRPTRDPTLNHVPYMHMTFAQMERRLDVAIFRAMLASSTRQARQFCVHGHVKVNGVPMRYSGYLLNPGDLFQIDMNQVLLATGAPKPRNHIREARRYKKFMKKAKVEGNNEMAENAQLRKAKIERSISDLALSDNVTSREVKSGRDEPSEDEIEEDWSEQDEDGSGEILSKRDEGENLPPHETATRRERLGDDVEPKEIGGSKLSGQKSALRIIITRIKSIEEDEDLSGKAKQRVRALKTDVKSLQSRVDKMDPDESDLRIREFESALAQFQSQDPRKAKKEEYRKRQGEYDKERQEERAGFRTLKLGSEGVGAKTSKNPVDILKPYITPWKPRPYMSPFAFIPRYLEVNHNVCAAVYLRHPVVQKGLAEVPTPYSSDDMQLAFAWYLRRR